MRMELYEHLLHGLRRRYALVATSRGCPFSCSYYCPYPFGFGRRIQFRRPEEVGRELELLHRNFAVSFIIFRDQVFTLRPRQAEAVCDEIIKRKLDIEWLCETRVDRVSEAILSKMREAGCVQVNYGMETGDEQLFAARAKPGATFAELDRALRWTEEAGMSAHVHLIVGFPEETWGSVRRTARVVSGLPAKEVGVAIMTPYPGTQLHRQAVESGLVLTGDWSRYTGFQPVMRTEHLSADDLVRAQAMILEAHRSRGRFRRNLNNRLAQAWTRFTRARTGREQDPAPGRDCV